MDSHTQVSDCELSAESFVGRGVRQATTMDAARLRLVMARAFHDDPIIGWLMPNARKRQARLRRFFGIELRHMALPHGRVWTTSDLTGAALVMPPGKWRVPLRATLLEGSAFGVRLDRAARLGAAMEWRHARRAHGPHYYVRDVGVLPEMQGRGLGSSLLDPTLECCEREGLPAYLEATSERSAALYESLGFQFISELRVADSPALWLMLRPARVRKAAS
jgi:GNAT superfamily N-acetyltransferase